MKHIFYSFLALLIIYSITCCSPADPNESSEGEIENPVPPPLAPPEDPDQPALPDDGDGDEPGSGDIPDTNTPDPDLPENPIEAFYEYNFVTSPTPKGYQMINNNNLKVVQPSEAEVPFAFYAGQEAQGNWYTYNLSNGKYALTSYALDMNESTSADNWLITDGLRVKYDRTLLYWKLYAMSDDIPIPQSYEVYLSTSPELSEIKNTKPIHQADKIYIDHLGNDKINNVDYLLKGYEGKTIYLAFHHNTKGKYKTAVTLAKISMSSFLLDDKDLEVSSMRCYWNSKPTNVTGLAYPIGADLSVEMTIKNMGYHITNTPLDVSYTYNGKTVKEKIESVSIKQGATYKYTFKQTCKYDGTPDLSVKVDPLPGETRKHANTRILKDLVTVKRPVMIRVLYEEASGRDCSVCSTLFHDLDKLDIAYPNRTVGAMHIVDRNTQWPYPIESTGKDYKNYIMSLSRGWAAPPYAAVSRNLLYKTPNDIQPGLIASGSRDPNLETPLTKDFTSQCYSPMEITATHRFSEDRKKMFVDVEVEALQDLEGLNYGIGGLVLEDNVQHKSYTMLNKGAPVFNHLTRGVLGDMKKGVTGVIPSSMKDGEKVTYTFEYDIPAMYDVLKPDPDQMYAAVMIINPDASILTCNKTKKLAPSTAAVRSAYRSTRLKR